jgi:hypothetical protein
LQTVSTMGLTPTEPRIFTCSLCKTVMDEQPITFVKDKKIWTVNIHICKNEDCLVKRGAVSTEYKTEQRGNYPKMPVVKKSRPRNPRDDFNDILGKDFERIE